MMMKKIWLAGAMAVAGAFGFGGDVAAQTQLAVKTKPSAPTLLTSKLTPDLAVIVAAKEDKAKLVGVNVQGEAIVEFAANIAPAVASAKLAEGPRNVDIQLSPKSDPTRRPPS